MINNVVKKTSFFLEKQKSVKKQCSKIFGDTLSFVKEKTLDNTLKNEKQSLLNIYDLISGLAEKLSRNTDDDIMFLEEQLEGLKSILSIKDIKKQKDVLNIFMGEDIQNDDNEPFDIFQRKIDEESLASMKQLEITFLDIKDCIKEGSIKEAEESLNVILDDIEKSEETMCENNIENDCNQCPTQNACNTNGSCSETDCYSCQESKEETTNDIFSFIEEAKEKEKENPDNVKSKKDIIQ